VHIVVLLIQVVILRFAILMFLLKNQIKKKL